MDEEIFGAVQKSGSKEAHSEENNQGFRIDFSTAAMWARRRRTPARP